MRAIRAFLVRLTVLFDQETGDGELAEELEIHLQMRGFGDIVVPDTH